MQHRLCGHPPVDSKAYERGISTLLKPKFHLLYHDTSRHDKNDVSCESWHAMSCVLRCACSNVADDEEAVVLACKMIFFINIYYFSSQMKLICLLKRITAIITLYTLQTKLPVALVVMDVSRLLRSSWLAVSRLLYSTRNTARTTFSCTKMHGLDNESWCNKWNLTVCSYMDYGYYLSSRILLSMYLKIFYCKRVQAKQNSLIQMDSLWDVYMVSCRTESHVELVFHWST